MTENMIDLTGLAHVWGKVKTLINGCAKTADLATVAISGSYNDLKDKPSVSGEYTLPEATSSTLGGVKIGENITVSDGTLSLTKTNVTSALGYTPSTTDTTYSVVTTSTNGLMSSVDKSKLDGLATVATSGSYSDLTNKPTITDTKVTNTLATTTKAYITGTTSSSTNTGTQVFDTGVYLDTTAGTIVATTFKTSTGIEIY